MSFVHYIGGSKKDNCEVIKWKGNFTIFPTAIIPYYEITSYFKGKKLVKQVFCQTLDKPEEQSAPEIVNC